jgi:lipopolysaccharide transport system permease protein
LPAKGVLSSFIPQFFSTGILILYTLINSKFLPITYLMLPVLLLLQFMAMMGVSYMLSAIGTYFKDIKDFVQLFGVVGMYAMPIFYLPGWVPELFKPVIYANPFSYFVWCYQDVFYFGKIAHPLAWGVTTILSLFIFIVGYRFFRKVKSGFGSAL